MNPPEQQWSGLKRVTVGKTFKFTLLRILGLVVVVAILYQWVFLGFEVSGDSMLPTLLDGDVHIAYRLAYRKHPPKRGDVVVIDIAGGRQLLVKRIIALPGERFSIKEGVVYINGDPLDEPYLRAHNPTWNRAEIILRPDEYFFVGDNRSMDMANHTADTVRIERIAGKVIY